MFNYDLFERRDLKSDKLYKVLFPDDVVSRALCRDMDTERTALDLYVDCALAMIQNVRQ